VILIVAGQGLSNQPIRTHHSWAVATRVSNFTARTVQAFRRALRVPTQMILARSAVPSITMRSCVWAGTAVLVDMPPTLVPMVDAASSARGEVRQLKPLEQAHFALGLPKSPGYRA